MHANVLDTPSLRQQSSRARGQAVLNQSASFLDSNIPLKGASHTDVVSYSVETIWRKAECIATLADGRKVKLHDAWQFIGYTGHDPVRFILFQRKGRHIEVQIDTRCTVIAVEQNQRASAFRSWVERSWGPLATRFLNELRAQPAQAKSLDRERIYTTIHGGQVTLAG
jgi:hypothetical protein